MSAPGGGGDRRRPLPPPFGGAAARRPTTTAPPPVAPQPAPPPVAPPAPVQPELTATQPPPVAPPAPVQPELTATQPPPTARRATQTQPPPAALAPAPMPAPMPAPVAAPMPARVAAPIAGPPPTATALPLRAPAEPHPAPRADELRIDRPAADFLRATLRRAFAKRIDHALVLPAERAAMTLAAPPIVDRNFQAFLAWRRSVLFVVACGLALVALLRAIDLFETSAPSAAVRLLQLVPVAIEAGFAGLCLWLLRDWVRWHRQRRLLALGFVVAYVAPFLIYLVPARALISGADVDAGLGAGLLFSVQAMLVLAPRAIATMPGVWRGAMVTKLLLPGTVAPGWLMVIAAPLGVLLAYLAMVQPYQLTGSGFFVATILALGAAAFFVGRAGWQLARTQPVDDAAAVLARERTPSLIAMGLAGTFALLALAELSSQLGLGALAVVTAVASFAVHVLAITLVTTDGVLAALDRARTRSGTDDDHARQLASFVGAATDAESSARNP